MNVDRINVCDQLKSRGLLSQTSHPEELPKALANTLTFYLGIDPTGPSLHCGHLVPLLMAKWLQRAGHRPLLVVGGGTAMIGDPSGKDEMRKLLSPEQIRCNVNSLRQQIGRFIQLTGANAALLLNNADWLGPLNYIDFLRDIGRYFSVNRMLSFDAYKNRLAGGLSFIEFNYQLLQSYDFLWLHQQHGCSLQIGGDDQWGNMVAGIELIRRVAGKEVQAATVPLVLRSDGKKMGKSEGGAVYLDPALTSVYDFYQYWRNTGDDDLERFLLLYTELPAHQCAALAALPGSQINHGKEVLAFEMCAMVHGRTEADKARAAARAAFGGREGVRGEIPGASLDRARMSDGVDALTLFCEAGLAGSRREARRLFEQGGAWVGDQRLRDGDQRLTLADFVDGGEGPELLLRAGKKRYFRFYLE